MRVRFSQRWAKEKYERIVREVIRFVKGSRSCKDLLVKVFFYRKPRPLNSCFLGNYRNVWIHGYYRSDFPDGRPIHIEHIITLKIADRVLYDLDFEPQGFREISIQRLQREIVGIFAHEFKHYLDMRKLRDKSKWRHWEVRAKKFAEKTTQKWMEKND